MLLAVSWLRRLVASLSLWRPGFVHVEFVVDKAALGQFFFQSFCFPINVLSPGPPYSILIYIVWRMNKRPFGGRSSET
jgi:hypothetical protein